MALFILAATILTVTGFFISIPTEHELILNIWLYLKGFMGFVGVLIVLISMNYLNALSLVRQDGSDKDST